MPRAVAATRNKGNLAMGGNRGATIPAKGLFAFGTGGRAQLRETGGDLLTGERGRDVHSSAKGKAFQIRSRSRGGAEVTQQKGRG